MEAATTIRVVPYDPGWPEAFEQIATELRFALAGVEVAGIEHVGSTSVPGLAAKPVIDVDVVAHPADVADAKAALERAGYLYEGMQEILDRHAFRAPPGAEPRRNVYLVVSESLALRNHLTLRDTLRGDAGLRDLYAGTKRRLADTTSDSEQYGTSKSEVIEKILARGGLSETERASIRLVNDLPRARRARADAVVADDGRRLWVEESGDRGGTPVVLCHGGPGVADDLEELRDLLIDSGRRVVRWDQRGAGRSDPEGPFTVERFVADLESVRRTVVGERCWVVGHSWGANLALAYAQQHSHNLVGVVYLCGIGLEWWPTYARRHKQHQAERLGPRLGARLEELRGSARTATEEEEYGLLYLRSELADPGDVDLAGHLLEGERRLPVSQAVNKSINAELKSLDLRLQKSRCLGVTVPVVAVMGECDPRPSGAVDSLVLALPQVTRVTVEGAGHWPWLERPGAVRSLLEEHIARSGTSLGRDDQPTG